MLTFLILKLWILDETLEANAAPERYRAGMVEDVEDYKKQLRGYNAEAIGLGVRYYYFIGVTMTSF